MILNALHTIGVTLAIQSAPDPLDALNQCSRVTAESQRLACFEDGLRQLREMRSSGQIQIIVREDELKAAEANFGKSQPAQPRTVEPPQRLESTIQSSSVNSNGKRIYTLANGSIWEQTDQNPARITPRIGTAVVVRPGALGSYFIQVGNAPEIRVRRIN